MHVSLCPLTILFLYIICFFPSFFSAARQWLLDFSYSVFFGSLSTLSNPRHPPPNMYARSRASRNPFILSHSISPLQSTHKPTISRRFFSLAHPPRLPPPDTRSTVLIFHRRGNRWPDKKTSRSTTFLSFLLFYYYYFFFLITRFTRTYLQIDFD